MRSALDHPKVTRNAARFGRVNRGAVGLIRSRISVSRMVAVMVPSPRIITSRRLARFLAMLAGGALVLAVGASFAVWLPKPAPTEQSAVALSDPEGMDAATTSASVTDTPTQANSSAPESAAPAPPQVPAPASP
ncbi:MAG: hypothetical protein WCG47_02230, partial [Dermatophilaceae bacterium]